MGFTKSKSALIFKVNQLGDNVVFLPVVQRLVAEAIFESLTIWTTPLAAPLYRNLRPRLNIEIVTREDFYPAWRSPAKLLELTLRVRSRRPGSVLVAEDMGNTAYFLALMSGAPRRLGIRPPYLKVPLAINHSVPLVPDAPAAEKAWLLGRALIGESRAAAWPLRPPAPDLTALSHASVEPFDVLIHPGASREYKRWPLSNYLKIADRLSRDFRVGWFIEPGSPRPDSRITPIPVKDLEGLVSHLDHTSLFIGNNSGPMNIASALGTPSLIFVGPSTRSWDPYWHADRFRVLRHDSLPCIACDPPGLPIREVCSNRANPMACMAFWTVERAEFEARAWLEKWGSHCSDLPPPP